MNHGQQSLCTVSPIPCTLISMNYLFHCLTPPFFPVPKGMDKDEATADSGPRPIAAIESVFRTRFRESLTAFAQLTDVCLLSIYIFMCIYLYVHSHSSIYMYINLYQHVHLNGFDCVCVRVSVSCVCTCSTFIHVALWQFLAHCSETICLRVPSLSLSLSLSLFPTHTSLRPRRCRGRRQLQGNGCAVSMRPLATCAPRRVRSRSSMVRSLRAGAPMILACIQVLLSIYIYISMFL